MYSKLRTQCAQWSETFAQIPPARQARLLKLSAYIRNKVERQEAVALTVICTHNSRRSHIGQLTLALAADYYNTPQISSYSGGTEATAFFPSAVATLRELGFQISTADQTQANPIYTARWSTTGLAQRAFSKVYDAPSNPQRNFAAILVCSSADADCPVVPGADFRIALPFEDPKAFDGTPLAAAKYRERTHEIGREMLFVMHHVQH